MIKPQSPCLGCEKREIGCHVRCMKYNKYRDELKKYNEFVQDNHVKEREQQGRLVIIYERGKDEEGN